MSKRCKGLPDYQQESGCSLAAVRYANLGWRVVPVHSCRNGGCTCSRGLECKNPAKHPRTCNGFKDATTDRKQIEKWWNQWPDANVGIATGAESNLVVIDIDPRHGGQRSWGRLVTQMGEVPDGPVANTGGGGCHLFFKHPGGQVRSRQGFEEGIDIRADGGFVVVPPSQHASGDLYTWMNAPEETSLPELPPAWLEWLLRSPENASGSPLYRDTRDVLDKPRQQKDTRESGGQTKTKNDIRKGSIDDHVEIGITKTLPTKPGARHKALFQFARWLRSREDLVGRPLRELRPIVDLWYDRLVQRLGAENVTADADENWADFSEGWGQVRFAGEGDYMLALLDRARQTELPREAGSYRTERAKLLIAWCRELQGEAGSEPFYLATTTVVTKLGYPNRMSAWNALRMLCRDGILELVEKGDKLRANRYRYVALATIDAAVPTGKS